MAFSFPIGHIRQSQLLQILPLLRPHLFRRLGGLVVVPAQVQAAVDDVEEQFLLHRDAAVGSSCWNRLHPHARWYASRNSSREIPLCVSAALSVPALSA